MYTRYIKNEVIFIIQYVFVIYTGYMTEKRILFSHRTQHVRTAKILLYIKNLS